LETVFTRVFARIRAKNFGVSDAEITPDPLTEMHSDFSYIKFCGTAPKAIWRKFQIFEIIELFQEQYPDFENYFDVV